tara:strand:- start:1297 stop:1590 length:294 start_codon:yes stop_codon:yes gene_type:complete
MNWLKNKATERRIRKLEIERDEVRKMHTIMDETWDALLEEWGEAKIGKTQKEKDAIDDEYIIKSDAFERITDTLYARKHDLDMEIIRLDSEIKERKE